MGYLDRAVLACVLCGGVAAWLSTRSPDTGQQASIASVAIGANKADASPSKNLLENSAFLKANPKYVGAIRQLITLAGYECPRVSFLWYRGESAFGEKLEALCGPAHTTSSYSSMHYAVYPKHFKVSLCEKYGVFGGSCPDD